ncbi:hypothetical protein BDR26DRAFT_787698, partial [Obelidium mucronatum]
LASQLKDYCSFLHEHRICHRDIKPTNLAIDLNSMELVVLDCDLMKEFPVKEDEIVTSFCGTKDYSDPEFVEHPERGFNVFELELYSMNKTCK